MSDPLRRPRTLAEVAEWSGSLPEFGLHMRDFLHHFQRLAALECLAEAPSLLAARFPQGEVADAYLAAVAATLADSLQKPRPRWVWDPSRFLEKPWFASPGPHLRATLLLESPAGFRERNLFVSANALSVA